MVTPGEGSRRLSEGDLTQLVETALAGAPAAPPPDDDPEDDEELFPDDLVGEMFSGCRIEERLGRGGMGSVYRARREDDDAVVVVKFLAEQFCATPRLRKRFEREGKVLARLPRHANLVQVFSSSSEPRPHLVMELVDGLALSEVLAQELSLPVMTAVRVARDVARGLCVVHELGIVHRDIKPANVVLTEDEQVKVVDFGLAKDLFASGITVPGMQLGTPLYMAPEQWGDHDIDERCDVFALGATLYHLLVGQPPFLAGDTNALAARVREGEFLRPRAIVPDVPLDVELIVFQMLQADRRFRYPQMQACAEDLDRVLRGERPRFPCLVERRGEERSFPLLPGRQFVIGRDKVWCDIVLDHASVSRRHVLLHREQAGFVLEDQGSTYGTKVDGMRVSRPVTLKNRDPITLGRVELELVQPWETRVRTSTSSAPVGREEVPAPILEALIEMGDLRAVLSLIEDLVPDTLAKAAMQEGLAHLLGEETADEVARRLAGLERRRLHRLPAQLHALTGDDWGQDASGWLSWWNGVRGGHRVQLTWEGPARTHRLRVTQGEPAGADFYIDTGGVFRIGRDEDCDLQLTNRSTSRRHATLIRLHRRLAIRDEASRLGTLVNGERCSLAFLDPGDTIALGQVELVLEATDAGEVPPRVGLGMYAVDPATHRVLVEMKHPSVATSLLDYQFERRRTGWIDPHAEALFPERPQRRAKLKRLIEKQYAKRAAQARALVPQLLGEGPPLSELGAWSQRLAERRADLPPQLLPLGWLAAARGE